MLKQIILLILFFLSAMIGMVSIVGLFTHLALNLWDASIFPPSAISAYWKSLGCSIVTIIASITLMENNNG